MKTTLITLVMALSLTSVAFSAGADAELKAIEQQWIDAYTKADTAALKTIEADDWTLVDSDGKVVTKAQDIKELGDKTFVCKSASMSDANVKMIGDNAAYVTSTLKMAGSYKGKDFSDTYRSLDIFEKKGGKWQATYSQITKMEKE